MVSSGCSNLRLVKENFCSEICFTGQNIKQLTNQCILSTVPFQELSGTANSEEGKKRCVSFYSDLIQIMTLPFGLDSLNTLLCDVCVRLREES